MKFCGKCGAQIIEGNDFCTNCGARLQDYGSAQNNPASTAYNVSDQNIPTYSPQQSAPGYVPPNNPYYPPADRYYSQSQQRDYGKSVYVEELSLFQYFTKCFRHYADFSGRARRKEFWGYTLFLSLFLCIGLVIMAVTSTVDNAMPMIILSLVLSALSIISVIPSLAVTVRRLHDTGKSGAWYFISFIPIIGEIWILVLMCLEGDRNSNYYGAPTKNYYNIYR